MRWDGMAMLLPRKELRDMGESRMEKKTIDKYNIVQAINQ